MQQDISPHWASSCLENSAGDISTSEDAVMIIWNNHTHGTLWQVGRAQQRAATIITWDSLRIAKNGLWPMLPPYTPEHLAPFPKARPAGAGAGPLSSSLSQMPLNSEFTKSSSSVLKSSTSFLGCYRESVLENYAQQANAVSVRDFIHVLLIISDRNLAENFLSKNENFAPKTNTIL